MLLATVERVVQQQLDLCKHYVMNMLFKGRTAGPGSKDYKGQQFLGSWELTKTDSYEEEGAKYTVLTNVTVEVYKG